MENEIISGTVHSVQTTGNMITKELNNFKEGNISGFQGIIVLLLAFLLFKKSIKVFKTVVSIVVLAGLLLYLGNVWG